MREAGRSKDFLMRWRLNNNIKEKKMEIKITPETKMAIDRAIAEELKKKQFSKNLKKPKNASWVEVAPYGLVGGMAPDISLMIFRNKTGSKRFAITLSQLQGEIAVQQGKSKEEPFRFITELLENLKITMNKCYFLKYDKGHIKTEIELKGHDRLSSMTLNACDIIPFAVYSGCRFYCTDKFIQEMQDQKMESSSIEKSAIPKPDYLN